MRRARTMMMSLSLAVILLLSIGCITGQNTAPNYSMKADTFLKGTVSNNFYIITVPEFLNKSKNETDWVIVDVRPVQYYSQGHIKGAISIPFSNLMANMSTIPSGKKVAVYCSSNKIAPYGVMALRVFGDRDAWELLDGLAAWKAAGQPVET